MERYRILEDVGLYYVTFTIVEWLPVFIDETACRIVTDSLNFCIRQKYLRVNAYVIMPTHLHAILFDVEFNSDRLKHTLDTCASSRVVNCLITLPGTCRNPLLMYSRRMPVKIVSADFGSRPGIPLASFRKGSGNRKWITFTTIRVGKDWCFAPKTPALACRCKCWRFSSALFWATREENDVQLSDVGWEYKCHGDLRSHLGVVGRPSPSRGFYLKSV